MPVYPVSSSFALIFSGSSCPWYEAFCVEAIMRVEHALFTFCLPQQEQELKQEEELRRRMAEHQQEMEKAAASIPA